MTRHDDAARLRHMLDYARKAVQLASGRTRTDLDADELFGLAMTRVLEVIGEAAAAGRLRHSRPPSGNPLDVNCRNAQSSDPRLRSS